ncbi:TlpA family protein disulfide reductase [Niabella hirudinis]|uniref:TlpA family protein disulfide reductase n=1 Tax=Niabella hirudinis TaxID=1285929 RepID=UPI003EB70F6B
MKRFTLACVLAGLCLYTAAQENTVPQPATRLYIGDQLSNITIIDMLNYPPGRASINQLQAGNTKVLLLDFWFTTCGACVQQIPKLLALQHRFKAQLQIVMVTFEPDSIVRPFIARWEQKNHKKLSLPIATADTLLQHYFDQGPRPNYAILGPNRVYMAHGSPALVTPAIIESMLSTVAATRPPHRKR